EDTNLRSEHPAFARYYELVEALQAHYRQRTFVGRDIAALTRNGPWTVEQERIQRLELPARIMARLHALNLHTWSRDPYAEAAFDPKELESLRRVFERIVAGEIAPPVVCGMAEVVLVRSS